MGTEQHKFESVKEAAEAIAYQRGGRITEGYEDNERYMYYEDRTNSMVYDLNEHKDLLDHAHQGEWIEGYEVEGDGTVYVYFYV